MVLLFSAFLLAKQHGRSLVEDKGLSAIFSFVSMAIVIGCFLENGAVNFSVLKNICALMSLFVLMFLLAQNPYDVSRNFNCIAICTLLLLLTVMLFVASYELYSLRAWAWFGDSNGERIYRSSSLLFNPNLYGMWCAILVIGFAYLFHQGNAPAWISLLGMSLSFAGIYLSGSRSAGFLVLFLLIGIAMLIRTRHLAIRWAPIALMLLIFCIIGLGAEWASQSFPGQQKNWHAIALLGYRFVSYPWQLVSYGLNHFSLPSGVVPEHVSISIEGRFISEARDSGWLVLYDDTGWVGAISVAVLWCVFCYWGIRAYLREPGLISIYALAFLFFSIGVGVVMRFQTFPLAIFIAIILAPCIRYWRTAGSVKINAGTRPQIEVP